MSWSLLCASAEYQLDGSADVLLGEYDGVGMAPVERFSSQGAQQHGATDVGYRLRPRYINLVLWGLGDTKAELWTIRETLMRLLRPQGAALILRKTLPDASVRQIDCYFESGLGLGTANRRGQWNQREGVILRCPDPTFYDPTPVTHTVDIVDGLVTAGGTISYTGSWDSYPVVKISPTDSGLMNVWIINTVTGVRLSTINAYRINSGEFLEIDCRYGYKTCVDQTGANKLSKLDADVDLDQWRLYASSTGGASLSNALTITVDVAANNNGKIYFTYYNRFLGV